MLGWRSIKRGAGVMRGLGAVGVRLASVGLGRFGVGGSVGFASSIRRGVDGHKSIEFKGGKVCSC